MRITLTVEVESRAALAAIRKKNPPAEFDFRQS